MKRKLRVFVTLVMTLAMSVCAVPFTAEAAPDSEEQPLVRILTLSDYQKWTSSWTDDWSTLQPQLTKLTDAAYEAGACPDYMLFGEIFPV